MTKEETNKIKGFAIIMMLLHHMYREVDLIPEGLVQNYYPFSESFFVTIVSTFKWVAGLFLIISGYGMFKSTMNKEADGNYIVKRLKSIYLPYWLCWGIAIAVYLITGKFAERFMGAGIFRMLAYLLLDFLGFSKLLGTPAAVGEYWYIGMLVQIILIYPLLDKLVKKSSVLAMTLSIILGLLMPEEMSHFAMPFWLPIFTAGMILAKHDVLERLNLTGLGKTLLFIAPVFTVGFNKLSQIPYAIKMLIPTLIWLLWLKTFISKIPVLNKILDKFGEVSNFIFLTHTILLYRTPLKTFFYSFGSIWINILVFMIVSYLFGYAVSKLYEWMNKHLSLKVLNYT